MEVLSIAVQLHRGAAVPAIHTIRPKLIRWEYYNTMRHLTRVLWPGLFFLLLLPPATLAAGEDRPLHAQTGPTIINAGLDCGEGYHAQAGIRGVLPDGWTAVVKSEGTPYLTSTQLWGREGSCDPNEPWWKWEKIEGHDSFMFMGGYARMGEDFPSPPFDATLYQRVEVTAGTAYSLSAWMLSLCGGSAMPNDCPPGQYIAKLVGVDTTGNTDPDAPTVAWIEDRRPHYESRWVNFSPVAEAEGEGLTIFLRVRSPYSHHGNHAFADGVQLVQAPSSQLTQVQRSGDAIMVGWQGDLGDDIRSIPAGNYRLRYTVQYQTSPGRPWRSWQTEVEQVMAAFPVPRLCTGAAYRFRVRATAQQPPGEPGAWPPHRFEGPWEESVTIGVAPAYKCSYRAWLPSAALE
jgi:hypothetical protein